MGLGHWLQSSVGVEVTTTEMGHSLASVCNTIFWPMLVEPLTGKDKPWRSPFQPQSFRAWRRRPVTLCPSRDGISAIRSICLDPHGGTPGTGGQPGTPSINIPLNSQVTDFMIFTEPNFSLDFDAFELFTGKRFDLIRTPTEAELADYRHDPTSVSGHDVITRSVEEMKDLQDGTYSLGFGVEGQVDDWFTLLNLGFRHTALANSDTHGKSSIESGCPRNFVQTGVDNPAHVTQDDIATAIDNHRVVASYGPFVRFWIDGSGIGSELTGVGTRRLRIESQAPSWMHVDRLELYENGTLIEEWDRSHQEASGEPWSVSTTVNPEKDSWYVVVANGSGSLYPLFTPVEIPN